MDEALLKRIGNHQMLRGSFCRDLGLLHGKMGLVLFFFHYARHTGKALYDDFTGELLDEIYEEILLDVSIRSGDGLCGIGWRADHSLETGLEGISYYVLRWLGSSGIHTQLFDVAYLTSWCSANIYSNQVILNQMAVSDPSTEFLSWKKGLKILLR